MSPRDLQALFDTEAAGLAVRRLRARLLDHVAFDGARLDSLMAGLAAALATTTFCLVIAPAISAALLWGPQ